MNAVDRPRLNALYATTDDPWAFRTSAYEQAKFRATREALPRQRYASALEIGCGNGELARHIAPLCAAYRGLDAVEAALVAARRAVPKGDFRQIFLPARLPEGDHDLIVLSEVLYFLSPDGLRDLSRQVHERWPAADVICVTWLGDSGNPLQGEDALALFVSVSGRDYVRAGGTADYRIDLSRGTG